jgi:hypothetical protein
VADAFHVSIPSAPNGQADLRFGGTPLSQTTAPILLRDPSGRQEAKDDSQFEQEGTEETEEYGRSVSSVCSCSIFSCSNGKLRTMSAAHPRLAPSEKLTSWG